MENKISDYKIVHEISPEALELAVKELINEKDWQPLGGLTVSFAPNQRPIFAQALVCYEVN